jgi:hypothetical protein
MTSTEAVNSVDSSSKTDFKNVLALAKARAEALKSKTFAAFDGFN